MLRRGKSNPQKNPFFHFYSTLFLKVKFIKCGFKIADNISDFNYKYGVVHFFTQPITTTII